MKTEFKNLKDRDAIEADAFQLTELFLNLLDNAYQAFSDKRGVICVSADYHTDKNILEMLFSDNGHGIESNDLLNIFNPFFTTKARGVGLGLSVCKQVVGLHNGTINIESKQGEGTKVFVSLPIRRTKA